MRKKVFGKNFFQFGVRNFCANREQSQTCLNYAKVQPKIMSEANN